MHGKKKDDNPSPQVAADREKALRYYHKQKEMKPNFLNNEADRKKGLRKAKKERETGAILVEAPANTTTTDGSVLVGLNMQNKTAAVLSEMVDALNQSNNNAVKIMASGRSGAKAPPTTTTEQTKDDNKDSSETESEGEIVESKVGRLSFHKTNGGFKDEESVVPRGYELEAESQNGRTDEDGFDDEDGRISLHTAYGGVEEEESVPRSDELAVESQNGHTDEEEVFGEEDYENDYEYDENTFSRYVNNPTIVGWIPQGAVLHDVLDINFGAKFLEEKLVGLGADRDDTFGQKIGTVAAMFRVRRRSDLRLDLDFLLEVRNKIVHCLRVNSFAAAGTSREQFRYVVNEARLVLDGMLAAEEERRRLLRKRRQTTESDGGIRNEGSRLRKHRRRST